MPEKPYIFRTPEEFESIVSNCRPFMSFISMLPTLVQSPTGSGQWLLQGTIVDTGKLRQIKRQLAHYGEHIALESVKGARDILLCSMVIHASSSDVIEKFINRFEVQQRMDRLYEKARKAKGKPLLMKNGKNVLKIELMPESPKRRLNNSKFVRCARFYPYYLAVKEYY